MMIMVDMCAHSDMFGTVLDAPAIVESIHLTNAYTTSMC